MVKKGDTLSSRQKVNDIDENIDIISKKTMVDGKIKQCVHILTVTEYSKMQHIIEVSLSRNDML